MRLSAGNRFISVAVTAPGLHGVNRLATVLSASRSHSSQTALPVKLNEMKCRSWPKKLAVLGSLLLALVLALVLVAELFPRELLTLDSGPAQADVLVVLGGGGKERPARAAELFKAGAAPLVICTGFGDASAHKSLLTSAGVPDADVELETRSVTTRENALFTISWMRARHLKSAIIVTTWYHSRRALACFEHYGPDLKFFSRPSYFGWSRPEWRSRGIKGFIMVEYFKMLGYWILYGVCPI